MARKSVSGTLKEEIFQARSNLDSILQKIRNSRDPSFLDSEDDDDRNDKSPAREGAGDGSPKRKNLSHGTKKRKREFTGSSQSSAANTYVVKLFDRNVDLAVYNESTPLYPICRAWMRNTANEHCIEQPPPSDPQAGGEVQFPNPYMKSKTEVLSNLKIPEPIPRKEKPLDIHAEPEDAADLLIKHIAHWKEVRESWKEAGKAYDARFSTSHAVIKQMYEAASK